MKSRSAMTRRNFIGTAAKAASLSALASPASLLTPSAERQFVPAQQRKLVIVLFGGGTRSAETIDDSEHRYIPRLWHDLTQRGTLFTNMRVEGKVVHPNSAGSVVTGHWEWADLDWAHPVDHPTVFEAFRKANDKPDTAVWAFVYASILANTGVSRATGYGRDFAANVVEPPTIPRATAEQMDQMISAAATRGNAEAERRAAAEAAELVRANSRISRSGLRSPEARQFLDASFAAWQQANGSTSHDAVLTNCAQACMKRFAPDVLFVAFGEIDCAHYGSWSRYTDAIRRTDELTWRLWQAANELPAYRGRTLFLILPDHGRELDQSGSTGFIHHSDFYTDTGVDEGCRRVWMLALGPEVPGQQTIETAIPITTVTATGSEFLGLKAPPGAADSIWHSLQGG